MDMREERGRARVDVTAQTTLAPQSALRPVCCNSVYCIDLLLAGLAQVATIESLPRTVARQGKAEANLMLRMFHSPRS